MCVNYTTRGYNKDSGTNIRIFNRRLIMAPAVSPQSFTSAV